MREVALGRIVMTRGIGGKMNCDHNFRPFINNCLQRHKMGDWGDLSEGDKALNDEALRVADSLLSVYHYADGTRIWVITEADRRVTTVLLPNER